LQEARAQSEREGSPRERGEHRQRQPRRAAGKALEQRVQRKPAEEREERIEHEGMVPHLAHRQAEHPDAEGAREHDEAERSLRARRRLQRLWQRKPQRLDGAEQNEGQPRPEAARERAEREPRSNLAIPPDADAGGEELIARPPVPPRCAVGAIPKEECQHRQHGREDGRTALDDRARSSDRGERHEAERPLDERRAETEQGRPGHGRPQKHHRGRAEGKKHEERVEPCPRSVQEEGVVAGEEERGDDPRANRGEPRSQPEYERDRAQGERQSAEWLRALAEQSRRRGERPEPERQVLAKRAERARRRAGFDPLAALGEMAGEHLVELRVGIIDVAEERRREQGGSDQQDAGERRSHPASGASDARVFRPMRVNAVSARVAHALARIRRPDRHSSASITAC
jgi:hypothetical protein